MKFYQIVLGCLFSASLFIGCNSVNKEVVEEPIQEEENWEPEMYDVSELVKVMRSMEEDLKQTKADLLEGNAMKEMPAFYADIKTAQATDPEEITDVYQALADKYIENYSIAQQADVSVQPIHFNRMIETCVACHSEYCQGPIPKIKKLLIKQ